MFCDLVGSTALSTQLDPEELREVVRTYQQTCAEVIQRYEGHVAQHLGDGLLVYFGYPTAHEDDAARAVRAGLEIIQVLHQSDVGARRRRAPTDLTLSLSLQVRIGIHTGLVVIGEMGSSAKREMLALGETPNLAARVQGVAQPDTVVISAATYRLVHGFFTCQDLGPREFKGIATAQSLYQVQGERAVQSRFEATIRTGLTPFIGRESELDVLRQHWERAQAGAGQIVLVSGEPGIGKSRLLQELKEQLEHKRVTRLEFHCSPYHQNSALYPIIDHLQRLLQFTREDAPATKLEKLRHLLSRYRFPQADTLSLLAALLSLPHPEGYPPITFSPQKQKEKTQAALVAWLLEEAEKTAVFCAWEDLHWADPSTLEVLMLLLDQAPTSRLLILLTFRPEFISPWGNRSHLSSLTLSRLGRPQVESMVAQVTRGKALSVEIVQQIVAKTDGVPLFVEELTKAVVEAAGGVGAQHAAPVSLAIPATLQDSLMARLDRLGPTKEIAQLGATIGREFSYELLHAVANQDEDSLQRGLRQLVEVELLYQRGLPPQTTYLFKHALIQDTAYQSLLKSTRQQYHQQIAQTLETQFTEIKETQPELLARHYTEASLIVQAIPYWQRAGERATQRSAYLEAIGYFTKGIELLQTLEATPERTQQELTLQLALGAPPTATKGWAAPEVEQTHRRALALCRQIGETPQLFPVLVGLSAFYNVRGDQTLAQELGEQLVRLADHAQDPTLLRAAHTQLAIALYYHGEVAAARPHFEQGLRGHDPRQPSPSSLSCLSQLANVLWNLGYPDQALDRMREAQAEARRLSAPFWQGYAAHFTTVLHYHRREAQAAYEQAEANIRLATEQGFPFWFGWARLLQGGALAALGQGETGMTHIQEGLATLRAMGSGVGWTTGLAILADASGGVGQSETGLQVVEEALEVLRKTGGCYYEAELYRLKGELLLAQAGKLSD